jgi:hypothetical protein
MPRNSQILRRIHIQRRRRKIHEDSLLCRQSPDQLAQPDIASHRRCPRIKPSGQDERHAAVRCLMLRSYTPRDQASPGCAPARDQSSHVSRLQSDQIDRQQQKGRGASSLRDAAAHGTRQTVSAPPIGNKVHLEPTCFDSVARSLARDHHDDLCGCKPRRQGESSAQ